MLNRTSPFPSSTSFATTFVFSIISPAAGKGGFGLAFVLAPSPEFPGAAADHYLGLFNSTTNDGDPSNHVFAIEFDTVNGVNDTRDTDGNHVGINVNSGVLIFATLYKRVTMRFEALEDWELECPHRFRYRDLYSGTRGFSDSEMIGIGGFGAVYRAIIPNSGSLLAVKKITPNSIQGIREFAAEIESLGRLRHKNLVNLQGWCKQRSDLLLVYDYIPNGSLDFFLYGGQRGLSWEQRFRVLKGIAAGLLYLHEEWEQVVIHRDVKSSNVLIDGEMNGRLGDFGLARLYSHGTAASHTTNVVGTVGYIAPELARTGKASTRSDVFAFGVLLLETASGRRPIGDGDGDFILVDWVTECLQMGSVLDSADARLERRYVAEEMEMVLGLGLICSHQRQESRPTMRQVVRYLNCEDQLPTVDRRGYTDDDALGSARRANSRLLEVVMSTPPDLGSADMYSSSSISGGSTSSIYNGR
ncbi:unnamed protein product [Linum tenue]|uniref:non-specific serine/threonine protein kinase n=1 Tax=Linum tenue TaxID=586396 RepID=A0AAV0L4J6_9ROSI|nr:unnamed protein product [Linum tenue]